MPTLAITGASGKIGGAVLEALMEYKMMDPKELVISTSSDANDPRWKKYVDLGVEVRHGTYDDQASLESSFKGCKRLLLVSTPKITMDFNNAPYGTGREAHHFTAIKAARTAGIRHIYYTSLAFQPVSKAGVMGAHIRTEDFLHMLSDTTYTIIREGLYNESWPLYFGHYDPKGDTRKEVIVAGDGYINWTSIADLGYGTARVITGDISNYAGVALYLCAAESRSLKDIAKIITDIKGSPVNIRVVNKDQYEKYYIQDAGMDPAFVRWWSSTYDALRDGECAIKDQTLEDFAKARGSKLKPLEETIKEMLEKKEPAAE